MSVPPPIVVETIGTPFDGYGRPSNHARAAAALREAGLLGQLRETAGVAAVVDGGQLVLPPADPGRGRRTTLLNEAALVAQTAQLGERVAAASASGHLPVVYGGDCTTLLGTVPGLARAGGGTGLVILDGHEDTMPLDVSEDGEAANVEIGLLLGLTGRTLGPDGAGVVDPARPALRRGTLAVLGHRDRAWRRRFNVADLADLGIHSRDGLAVSAGPAEAGRAAVRALETSRWWLHVDVDVLDPLQFPAQGLPEIADEPGGLSLPQLRAVLLAAIAEGGCAGLSLAIYDPDQDPDGSGAATVVDLLSDVVAGVAAVGLSAQRSRQAT